MTRYLLIVFSFALLVSCHQPTPAAKTAPQLTGTWKLLEGTTISGTDTVVTNFTQGQEMIKIITPGHFSFLRHDLNKGQDSSAIFVAGGGRVIIKDSTYIEKLDFCNYREWEAHEFLLSYEIKADTLTTRSVEKVEALGIDQLNLEKFVRVK